LGFVVAVAVTGRLLAGFTAMSPAGRRRVKCRVTFVS
jgi:hypothetical protein